VECSLEECIHRDPKGLYKRALAGEISGFTGLDDPYEEPLHPEVMVSTATETVEVCVEKILLGMDALVRRQRGCPQGVPMK